MPAAGPVIVKDDHDSDFIGFAYDPSVDLVRHLRYFVTIAETRHYGQAAVLLGVTQPPLSQGIQRLEKRLGSRLFDRSARGVRITEAGKALLPRARSVLDAVDELLTSAELATRPQRMSMSVPPDLGAVGLAAIAAVLRHVAVDPVVLPSVLAVDRVAGGQLDLAVVHHPGVIDGTVAGPVVRLSPVLLVAADGPLGDSEAPVALRRVGLPVATFARWQQPATFDQLVDGLRRAGHSGETVQVETLGEIRALAAAGAAVGFQSDTEPGAGLAARPLRDDILALRLRVVVPPHDARRHQHDYEALADAVGAALG